eukprot:9501641-Karenia_brevis.AAC.1
MVQEYIDRRERISRASLVLYQAQMLKRVEEKMENETLAEAIRSRGRKKVCLISRRRRKEFDLGSIILGRVKQELWMIVSELWRPKMVSGLKVQSRGSCRALRRRVG